MKQYRAWYTGDNPPLLFEMVYIPNDELYFRMAEDHEFRYPFETPFIDTDWIVEEGIGIQSSSNKEIFQGDIEKGYDDKTRIFCWHFNRWVLRSEDGRKEEINKMWADHHKYNIIGNIHQGEHN